MLESLEAVLRAEGNGPRRTRARSVVDCRVAGDRIAGKGESADRVLGEAGAGEAGGELEREACSEIGIGLHVEPLRDGGAEIIGKLQAAIARDVHVLLDVVPLDV